MASLYPLISEIFPYHSPSDLPPTEEIEMEVFSPKVPSLALAQIFPHLPLKDLVNATEVSKVWREAATHPRLWRAFDLQKLFPIKVFDYREWAEFVDLDKYSLSFEELEPIDNRFAIPELTAFFAELKKKNVTIKEQCQVTLLTIPKCLCLHFLKAMIADPKKGNPMKTKQDFQHYGYFLNAFVTESYRILITNACLPDSEEKEFGELKSLVKKIGCRVPKTLEVAALIGMTHVSSTENPPLSLYFHSLSTACDEEAPTTGYIRVSVKSGVKGKKTDDKEVILKIKAKEEILLERVNHHRKGRGIGAVKTFHGGKKLPSPIAQLFTRKTVPKQTAPILGFPDEVYLEGLFNFLTPQELARVSQVCKRWYPLAFDASLWKSFDLEKLFRVTVFDEKAWKRYADLTKLSATVDDIGPMDLRVVIPQIVGFYARLRKEGVEIEGNKKITLLTVPKELSLQGLEKFASEPREGNRKVYVNGWEGSSSPDTYRILITDSILQGTRNTSTEFKQRILEKISCEMPRPFHAMALCITRYISSSAHSPLCLYKANPLTRTQCNDRHERVLTVGGFSPDGGEMDYADLYPPDSIGVGAVQVLNESKFEPLTFSDGK